MFYIMSWRLDEDDKKEFFDNRKNAVYNVNILYYMKLQNFEWDTIEKKKREFSEWET